MIKKLALLLLAAPSLSCTHNILVVDEAGQPIEGAQVYPVARGFRYAPVTTNSKGSVYVRQDIPTVEMIAVSKPGYASPSPVSYNLPKPITVVLKNR